MTTSRTVFSRRFWTDAADRAIKTVAQSALGVLGATALFWEVDWSVVTGTALMAAVLSLLTSIADPRVGGAQEIAIRMSPDVLAQQLVELGVIDKPEDYVGRRRAPDDRAGWGEVDGED